MKSNKDRKQGTMHRQNMDGILVPNVCHSMTLLQLIQYYQRNKTKIEFRSTYTVLNHVINIIE